MWEGGRVTGSDGEREGGIISYFTVGNFSKGKFHLVRINAVFFFFFLTGRLASIILRLSVGLGTRLLAGQLL